MVEIYRFTVCTRETTEVVVNKAMDQLPDNLLLEIFRFLPVKDRCIVGRYRNLMEHHANLKSLKSVVCMPRPKLSYILNTSISF